MEGPALGSSSLDWVTSGLHLIGASLRRLPFLISTQHKQNIERNKRTVMRVLRVSDAQ